MTFSLTLTSDQYEQIRSHLTPPDGNEAIVLATCGTHLFGSSRRFFVNRVDCVPHQSCLLRTPTRVTWDVSHLVALLDENTLHNGWFALKLHSHPANADEFSRIDDESDIDLHQHLCNYYDKPPILLSAIFLPDGVIKARLVDENGRFHTIDKIAVVGHDIKFMPKRYAYRVSEGNRANEQVLGTATSSLMAQLKIGVIGCSGTGSIVTEQLARLGVGELVLVDNDVVEERNLNRILNSTAKDAKSKTPKVHVMSRAVEDIGLCTSVDPHFSNVADAHVIDALADCDVLFGCVDTIFGRVVTNLVSSYYSIPYFDLGVLIEASGDGHLAKMCGSLCYVAPGKSDLLSMGVFTQEQMSNAFKQHANPEDYAKNVKEGYIRGTLPVNNPAVISVNMLLASLAVNDFLARVHHFRYDGNDKFDTIRFELVNHFFNTALQGQEEDFIFNKIGYGDIQPPLGLYLLQ